MATYTDLYCSPSDVYAFGARRGAFANDGRVAQSVSVATGLIELGEHGLSLDDPCSFRAEGAGSGVPSPLQAGVTYYAIPSGADHFAVAATVGGPAIALSTAGSRLIVCVPLQVDAAIYKACRLIDDSIPAHLVPLVAPYPPTIVVTAAELAAGDLGVFASPEIKSFAELLDRAQKRVATWAKGRAVRPAGGQTEARLAVGAVAVGVSVRNDWRRYGGIG